jgi:hypothetical protein
MARTEVDFNDDFFDDLGHSAAVVGLCRTAAESALGVMRSTAPEDSGDYKRGFHITTRESAHRTVVVVENNDPKTLLIEAQKGIMARALKKAGR